MKKLALIAFALALTASAQTTTRTSTSHSNTLTTSYSSGGGSSSTDDVKDDLFAGTESFAKNASSATEINMGPDGLGMAAGYGKHGAHNMVLNVVRSYSYDKPGMYNMAEVEAYRQKVNTGDWHCSVHTRDMKTGESTDICNKHRTDGMVETAIITVEPKELTFIHTIRKQDDKSENGGDAVSYFGGDMPVWAMLQQGRMAAMQAKLQADSVVMRARNGMYADLDDPMLIKLDSDHLAKDIQRNIQLKAQPGPASDKDKSFFLAMPATNAPKQDFMIVTPDQPAPAAPAAPATPPAPAAPQQ